MPYLQLDGLNIYYEVHGQGSPLVMIRGLGSNLDHWYAQAPSFAQYYRVVIFDNRGIARSSDPGGDYAVPIMAADTLGLMDALDLERAYVLGFSMGGMIAQELAINHPNRIGGLVLVCTHCGGTEKIESSPEVAALFKEMNFEATPAARAKVASTLFDRQTWERYPEIVNDYFEVWLKHPARPEILIKQMQAVFKHDTFSRLGKITAPTFVLTGSSDLLIPSANSKILAERIPGAELRVIAGGGHEILVEQPALCNEAILHFLTRCENG